MDISVSLCWLFLAFSNVAESRLSDKFKECLDSFYKGELPTGFQGIAKPYNPEDIPEEMKDENLSSPAYICQKYNNVSYYATLYDRGRRIPLYSAYILEKRNPSEKRNLSEILLSKKASKNRPKFKVEPQLVFVKLDQNMRPEYQTNQSIYNFSKAIDPFRLLRMSQAVDDDYKNNKEENYTRGHINPNGHHKDWNRRNATFTLTNVVPKVKELNQQVWEQYEHNIISNATGCHNMYMVTGVVPGTNWIRRNRVNIPSHVWSAHCCTDKNNGSLKSGAVIATNNKSDIKISSITISHLQGELKTLLKTTINIQIFSNNCTK